MALGTQDIASTTCERGPGSGLNPGAAGQFKSRMECQSAPPDAAISLHPDRDAPRAARHCVRTVDRPSPDLRDVVVLLASELVTRAVMLSQSASDELLELRVWMPADVVRVELAGAVRLVCGQPDSAHPHYELLLVDELADRWSIEVEGHQACIWFEIDRHAGARPVDAHRESLRAEHAAPLRDDIALLGVRLFACHT